MESRVLEDMGYGDECVGGHREWRVVFGGYGMWVGMYGKT